MKRMTGLVLGVFLLPLAVIADDKSKSTVAELTDPVAILKKVNAAANAVTAVQYDITLEATGVFAARVGKFKGSYTATGVDRTGGRPAPEKYMADLAFTLPGSEKAQKITGGSDGETYFVVHHESKTAYEDIDPAVMGNAGGAFATGFMIEFLLPDGFNDEINGKQQELKGSKEIDGVDCYEVHVVYAAEQAPEAIWYFSKKDLLPRRRVDVVKRDDMEGTITRTITNLKVNPKLEEDAFTLKLPDGYTKTDDFAPNLTP